ncbi:hypothetical protein NEFER03_0493 [Nematocida sp. LUAm3]|nr:hypothetical protein NEFER03_0493 [Nematocida sp. LUAm3]KAI5175461.1 hypothetical protein NEFER02_1367 [Nematocida sp. LUAm2]KAI5178667.1 hypothetical protein NEFER01_1786 [Nematocida sp. LUAm1]
MKIFLRRERRRNYTTLCTWKMFVVFITLLSIGLSTESDLEESTSSDSSKSSESSEIDIDYEKISKVLIDNFDINPSGYIYNISWGELSTTIQRIENTDKFSIDLEEFDIKKIISNEEKLNQNSDSLEAILRRIETITVNVMHIDTEKVTDKLFSMLIERIVVTTEICISGGCWKKGVNDKAQSSDKMETNETDVSSTKEQAISIEIPRIVIHQFSEWFIEDILECIKIYTIKTLVITNNNIRNLNLEQFSAKNVNTVIHIEYSLCLESIVFPGNDITKSLSVKLYGLPNLKSVGNRIGDPSIAIELKSLWVDKESFRALLLGLAFRVNAHKSINNIFMVQNTFIDYAPYTFKEPTSKSSVSWIETVNITFLTECNRHISQFNKANAQPYYLNMLKSIGINCSRYCGYKNFVDKNQTTKKYMDSINSMETLTKSNRVLMMNYFSCPSNSEYCRKIPFFRIDLEKSKEIQKIIDEFQKKHDMLYLHAHHTNIQVRGYNAPNIWFSVLVNAFKWLGQEIRIDNLSFHGMNELSNLDVKKEESKPSSIELPKIMFILTKLCFYSSEVSFIKYMLEHYNYTPEATILIDCHKIEKKDFLDLCEKIREHEFSKVILRNAPKIVEKLRLNPDQIDPDLKNRIMLSKGKPEYCVPLSTIIDCISLSTTTAFSLHFSKLIRNRLECASMEIDSSYETSCYLVSRSVKEACDGLSEVMEKKDMEICFILYLNVFIYNYCSNDDSFTTIEQLDRLVSLINKVFKKLESLSVLNIRMKENEYKNIKTLNTLIDPLDIYRLKKGIFLRGYIINDEEEEKTALSTQQKNESCLHEEVETSEEEKLETLNYRIEHVQLNYLVNQKLQERDVFVDSNAFQFILKSSRESVDGCNRPLWEQDLIDGKKCTNCKGLSEFSKSIYIISKCGHWICYECIFQKMVFKRKNNFKCHIDNMDICSSFYHLLPIKPTPKDLTENDFEMVKTNVFS